MAIQDGIFDARMKASFLIAPQSMWYLENAGLRKNRIYNSSYSEENNREQMDWGMSPTGTCHVSFSYYSEMLSPVQLLRVQRLCLLLQ